MKNLKNTIMNGLFGRTHSQNDKSYKEDALVGKEFGDTVIKSINNDNQIVIIDKKIDKLQCQFTQELLNSFIDVCLRYGFKNFMCEYGMVIEMRGGDVHCMSFDFKNTNWYIQGTFELYDCGLQKTQDNHTKYFIKNLNAVCDELCYSSQKRFYRDVPKELTDLTFEKCNIKVNERTCVKDPLVKDQKVFLKNSKVSIRGKLTRDTKDFFSK